MKNYLTNTTIIILTIGLFSGIGISAFSIFLTEQQAQGTPHGGVDIDGKKIYRLAGSLVETIDPMTYQNGTLIQYGAQNLPEIIIFSWNDLSAVNRAQIESQAITDNWHDVTCLISLCA